MIPTDSYLTADVNEAEKIMRNTAVTNDNKETIQHYLHVTRKARREIILKERNNKNNTSETFAVYILNKYPLLIRLNAVVS
jgi:hypothetical protein